MLSTKAQETVNDYFNLPFENVDGARCPYFNNLKRVQRGQLRALNGKGTPKEITEEAKIMSIQYGHNIFDKHGLCHLAKEKRSEEVKKYLIDHDLGVDCSAFVVHVLREHIRQTKNFDFLEDIFIVPPQKIFRYLISKLRPVENISVSVLADEKNSDTVKNLEDVKTGDMIIMINTGPNKTRNHILLITEANDKVIKYAHARAWPSEGKYGHGVSRGQIKITDKNKNLLKQEWIEKKKINQDNETYLEAKNAEKLEIKRIKKT